MLFSLTIFHSYLRIQIAYEAIQQLTQTRLLIIIGLGFFLFYTNLSAALSLLSVNKGIFITDIWKPPVIIVEVGIFVFNRVTFRSRIINGITRSAFAMYPFTDYTASEKPLWVRLFKLRTSTNVH